MIALGIHGVTGRMGRELVKLSAHEPNRWRLAAGLTHAHSPHLGHDVGTLAGLPPLGVNTSSDLALIEHTDIVIDFSSPDGTLTCLEYCIYYKKPLVIGTTGLDDTQKARIAQAGQLIPIVLAPNMSLGVTVLAQLSKQARDMLCGWDVGILDVHHKHKRDAPSGTARLLEQSVGDCSVSSLRVGSFVGEHSVIFEHNGEQIILTHKAGNRHIFAQGALVAAQWLICCQKAGLYDMTDVLTIN